MLYQDLQQKLPLALQQYFRYLSNEDWSQITEIRLRTERPVAIDTKTGIFYLSQEGKLLSKAEKGCVMCSSAMVTEVFLSFCNHSVYAYEESLKHGYLTLSGGHRIGIAGKGIYQNGEIQGIQSVTSLNIRVARTDIANVDKKIVDILATAVPRILIAGEPRCGKTTLLRAIAQKFSEQKRNVTVIDERMELWPCTASDFFRTPPMHCDVLSGYKKGDGMQIALRCLAPELLICDEIGSVQDAAAIEESLHAGTGIVASVHAKSKEDILYRSVIRKMIEQRLFDYIAFMQGKSSPGRIDWVAGADDFL